jgi:hypothetical protein
MADPPTVAEMEAELRRLKLPARGSKEQLQARLRGLGAAQLHDFRERTMAARAKQHAIHKRKMCEGCGLKGASTGLASEGKKRWCAGCGAAEGAVRLLKQKMCEGCGLKQPNYGLASEGKKRWCAGCGAAEGAVSLQKWKMRLDKRPWGTAGATAGAGAKYGARSVQAREVFGGDDIDSDGDEAPRAEEEAAGGAAGGAEEEVKAEPAPALEPEIKPEPSYSRHQQQQPTSVRSAKRRAVWASGGAGGPRA